MLNETIKRNFYGTCRTSIRVGGQIGRPAVSGFIRLLRSRDDLLRWQLGVRVIIYLFVRISKQPRNFRYPKPRKLSESSSRKNFCIFEFRLSNSNSRIFRNDSIALLSQFVTMLRFVTQKILYNYGIYFEMMPLSLMNVFIFTLYSKIKGLMDSSNILISFFST